MRCTLLFPLLVTLISLIPSYNAAPISKGVGKDIKPASAQHSDGLTQSSLQVDLIPRAESAPAPRVILVSGAATEAVAKKAAAQAESLIRGIKLGGLTRLYDEAQAKCTAIKARYKGKQDQTAVASLYAHYATKIRGEAAKLQNVVDAHLNVLRFYVALNIPDQAARWHDHGKFYERLLVEAKRELKIYENPRLGR